MISSFRHKGLKELYEVRDTAKIQKQLHARIIRRLDALSNARVPKDLHVPSFDFHPLQGFNPIRYAVHVNGPLCITFRV
jgi:proteic killer suppression protein